MHAIRTALLFALSCSVAGRCHALETALKPGMDKEREAMVANWKKALSDGDQAAIEKVLADADARSGVAFGMSDWPQAVAEAASKAPGPLQELMLGHLRRHRALINKTTSDWIRILFKRDVLDPHGEKVREWAKAGAPGITAAADALKAADEARRADELAGLLEALGRCGNERFLPVAAAYLGHDDEAVAQAALGVFKIRAKDLEPDLRSPLRCLIWWRQTGQELLGGR